MIRDQHLCGVVQLSRAGDDLEPLAVWDRISYGPKLVRSQGATRTLNVFHVGTEAGMRLVMQGFGNSKLRTQDNVSISVFALRNPILHASFGFAFCDLRVMAVTTTVDSFQWSPVPTAMSMLCEYLLAPTRDPEQD